MAHTEIGFEVINKFIQALGQWGNPDFQPKLIGRAINMMISPLPRNKRAKNPRQSGLTAAGDSQNQPKREAAKGSGAPAAAPAAAAAPVALEGRPA
jgi:translation initiation factor IF-3